MYFDKFTKLSSSLFCILIFGSLIFAQAQTVKSKPEKNFDVQHYTIHTSFDRANRTVFGDTIVSLKPLNDNFKTFALDAAGLKFETVTLESSQKSLIYRQNGNKVLITLDQPYKTGDLIAVRFKYSAQPKKGIYFVNALIEDGKVSRAAQIWTQGEAEEAHHWFPSYDFPDDKATSEQFITVAKGETAIANGNLVERKENADGSAVFHYKMPIPHPTYLTSFVIGVYVKVSDNYKSIPLGFYVYSGSESIVPIAYGRTKDMFRVFEELTGVDYPFNKYDQTIVAKFQFGGMENITATTMADTEIFYARMNKGLVDDLVSHELAHSWFGNLVTCKNWSELWLNEGFATFMEAAFREKFYGRADYMRKIQEDAEEFFAADVVSRKRPPLFNAFADPETVFNEPAFIYEKGGVVIHILRETIGDEAFWRGINLYLNRHKFENVETVDLQKAMEETSGKKLDWFFKQWVYGQGFPSLDVRQSYNASAKKLNLIVSQTQKNSAIFTLPIEIEIQTKNGVKSEKLQINKLNQTFSLAVDEQPTKIVFDKDGQVPLMRIRIQPLAKARPARGR